jgi:activating signal cointegrator 1
VKALSLWQPWATLVVTGWKGVEVSGGATTETGLVAIHATASLPPLGRQALEECTFQEALIHAFPKCGLGVTPTDLPYGAILGVAKLGGCKVMTQERIDLRREFEPMEYAFGDYKPGRFEWHIERAHRFAEPIPCKGRQKLWEVRGAAADALADRQKGGLSEEKAAQLALADQGVDRG